MIQALLIDTGAHFSPFTVMWRKKSDERARKDMHVEERRRKYISSPDALFSQLRSGASSRSTGPCTSYFTENDVSYQQAE